MNVLNLCKEFCPDKLPINVGVRLGDGSNGECLSIVGDPNMVIKLSILYDYNIGLYKFYEEIRKSINYIIQTKPRAYVNVYEQGYFGTFSRYSGGQKFILYYYLMEKLQEISEDEARVFHSILSHEDRLIKKNWSSVKIDKILKSLSTALDFDASMVKLFLEDIKLSNLIHRDLHSRNIMKTISGNFKLIDLDSLTFKE